MGELWNELVQFLVNLLVGLHGMLVGIGLGDVGFLGNLSWGLTIIIFTLVMRTITFPFNVQQIRSSRAMQAIQPQIKELQKLYGKDKERLMQEQMRLYKEAKINPMMGCLPMLIQMPVWMALYQALYALANNQDFYDFKGGFLWLSSLAHPEGVPYILAITTGISQWIVQRMMTPNTSDPQQRQMNNMMQFMPIMFVFFAFQVPSGLVLYWVTSNLFSIVQQYFMMGWGGLFPLPWQRATAAATTGAITRPGLPADNGSRPAAQGEANPHPLADYRGPGGGKRRKIKRR